MDGRALLIVLLMMAVAGAWWWSRDSGERDVGSAAGEVPDYSMSGFLLTETNVSGRPGHTLAAETLYHYPERAESTLMAPLLRFFEGDRPVWEISARHGTVYDADRSVLLEGEVHVRYSAPVSGRGFEIHTEELYLWPDERRAETEAAVRIIQQSGITDSIGMKADLEERRVRLLSHVRGRYDP
ncbi:MAG: LPS export ABC transporter periplasmic protein LptC [Gammaproteobacteria bacterium]|jgi:lipopolysaccharide export system protein LptC|nr:LPS export ABC transporter periplasmic protein LptC [Gammaproteobacteria bacterium]